MIWVAIQYYLNNAINLRPLTPNIMSCHATEWRSFCDHRFCDVTSPDVQCGVVCCRSVDPEYFNIPLRRNSAMDSRWAILYFHCRGSGLKHFYLKFFVIAPPHLLWEPQRSGCEEIHQKCTSVHDVISLALLWRVHLFCVFCTAFFHFMQQQTELVDILSSDLTSAAVVDFASSILDARQRLISPPGYSPSRLL